MAGIQYLFDLTGRVALVTGGAGLLGTEFCQTLAEAGARVVVADLNRSAAQAQADSMAEQGFQAVAVEVDVTQHTSVHHMVSATLQTFGQLDILVNSAALDPKFDPQSIDAGHAATFENYPVEAWRRALDVNLTGAFLCCQAVTAPMLEQDRGVIINLSSIYGLTGPYQRMYQRPGQPPQYKPAYYSVTKWGILGLTQYLATYFAGKNIRVNAISPGGVFNGHDDAFVQAYSARTVLGRMAYKNEMNGALLYLASDASAYMTGANLVVDGGWSAW
jgi:NAD(P)-dependent dehydrogenase (short-subunit alcohol dehydrogenase family)